MEHSGIILASKNCP